METAIDRIMQTYALLANRSADASSEARTKVTEYLAKLFEAFLDEPSGDALIVVEGGDLGVLFRLGFGVGGVADLFAEVADGVVGLGCIAPDLGGHAGEGALGADESFVIQGMAKE